MCFYPESDPGRKPTGQPSAPRLPRSVADLADFNVSLVAELTLPVRHSLGKLLLAKSLERGQTGSALASLRSST